MERIVEGEIPTDQYDSVCSFGEHAKRHIVDSYEKVKWAGSSDPFQTKGLNGDTITEMVNLDL